MDKIEYKRLKYEYQGRTIYEWEQTLEDVHMYVQPPPGVTAKMMDCKIGASHLKLGIKGNPPFIDEDWEQTVNASESTWMMEDGELHLVLTKGSKGVTWRSLIRGHTAVDEYTASEVQKSLMLERFQAENPGMDFSGATFNGAVPDPKTFMGGVGYK
mmetsp:Transcript_66490/g.182360  ORF Transcript_66490/g.182360 Transcript_66490/m.182360 type:complete len:157 (-) Transcript_66490:238-708(-)